MFKLLIVMTFKVLKRLGLAHGLESGLVSPDHTEKVKNCLPHALRDYVDDIIQGTLVNKSLFLI